MSGNVLFTVYNLFFVGGLFCLYIQMNYTLNIVSYTSQNLNYLLEKRIFVSVFYVVKELLEIFITRKVLFMEHLCAVNYIRYNIVFLVLIMWFIFYISDCIRRLLQTRRD